MTDLDLLRKALWLLVVAVICTAGCTKEEPMEVEETPAPPELVQAAPKAVVEFSAQPDMAPADSASLYVQGKAAYDQRDYLAAFGLWSQAATEGDREAQSALGSMYINGVGTAVNTERGLYFLNLAAIQGEPYAQYGLADLLRFGKLIPQNCAGAVRWMSSAAEQGLKEAETDLGVMYDLGECLEQNKAQAVNLFQRAALRGDRDAQLYLALKYRAGVGVPRDYEKEVQWLRASASQGQSRAQWYLGNLLIRGQHGLSEDVSAGVNLLGQAELAGNRCAAIFVATLVFDGRVPGQPRSSARSHFQVAAGSDPVALAAVQALNFDESLSDGNRDALAKIAASVDASGCKDEG